ncbi:MAG: alpha/beta hydrolase [Betaproteobacteria bacterium]|nr:alpha/beta hydrolase [Betaproteobacteria bacterium]
MDRAALDAAYNNSAAVSNSTALMADLRARSDRLRSEMPRHVDLAYGDGERNRIDYFPAASRGPLVVFIHGGYWQMRAREDFSALARGPLALGIHIAMVGYTLAPDISLTGIVAEIRSAIRWLTQRAEDLGADADRIYVSGWSAGAHLTACVLDEPAVKGGLAISGIYDLEPMRCCYINDKLNLSEEELRHLSPLKQISSASVPLTIACGGSELPELRRQSADYAAARARAGLPGRIVEIAGCNHFTILEELVKPAGALTSLLQELVEP